MAIASNADASKQSNYDAAAKKKKLNQQAMIAFAVTAPLVMSMSGHGGHDIHPHGGSDRYGRDQWW